MTQGCQRRAHAPGYLFHGMTAGEQRRAVEAWERWEACRRAREAPAAEDAPDAPAPTAAAEAPAPAQWARLWDTADDTPPGPTPAEVRRRKRDERERRLLLWLLERHGEAVWGWLAPRVRQLLADELGPALEVLLAQRRGRR